MQWLRQMTVRYGEYPETSGQGPQNPWVIRVDSASDFRVQFNFTRTNTAKADRGVLRFFNLPKKFRDAIREGHAAAGAARRDIFERVKDYEERARRLRILARANRVFVHAGYQDNIYLVFQGDIDNLVATERQSGMTDDFTEITLGDTIISLKYGYLNKTFGPGTPWRTLFNAIPALAGIDLSEQAEKTIRSFESVPNRLGISILKAQNGYVAHGGITYALDDIVEQVGLQWFVRDGQIWYMLRGSVLEDFALFLTKGTNILSRITHLNETDVQFRAFLDGRLIPGRGIQIINEQGKQISNHGYRVDTVTYNGDTHGTPWYTEITASSLDEFTKVLAKKTFTALTTAEAEAVGGIVQPGEE